MAEAAFGQIGDEEPLVIHDEPEADFGADLPENVAHHWIEEKLAELVLNRCDGFTHEARIVTGVFVCPESANKRITHLPNDPFAILGIGEKPVHSEQRGAASAL